MTNSSEESAPVAKRPLLLKGGERVEYNREEWRVVGGLPNGKWHIRKKYSNNKGNTFQEGDEQVSNWLLKRL